MQWVAIPVGDDFFSKVCRKTSYEDRFKIGFRVFLANTVAVILYPGVHYTCTDLNKISHA